MYMCKKNLCVIYRMKLSKSLEIAHANRNSKYVYMCIYNMYIYEKKGVCNVSYETLKKTAKLHMPIVNCKYTHMHI